MGTMGLYHKWKPGVEVDSALQATLLPGPGEDEVDTYNGLSLAGKVRGLLKTATLEHSGFVFS